MEYNYTLFNAVTDAIKVLQAAQQAAEEVAITAPQVFFWKALGENRCGFVQAEDPDAAISILFDELGEVAVELRRLEDTERFYEADCTSSTAPKSSQLEG